MVLGDQPDLPVVALTAALGQSDEVEMLRVTAHRFMLMAIANWIYSTFFSCHRVASSEATHLSSTTHTHREKSAALARLRSTWR